MVAEAEKDIVTTRVIRHAGKSQAQCGGVLCGLIGLCYMELGVQSKPVPSDNSKTLSLFIVARKSFIGIRASAGRMSVSPQIFRQTSVYHHHGRL